MPTLQQALAADQPPPTTPMPMPADPNAPPSAAMPAAPTLGASVLPDASASPPLSAQDAIAQIAKERFGGNFVDTYGDLLGTRQPGPGDYLRNAADTFISGDPSFAREQGFQGATMRAHLVEQAQQQARQQRLDLMKLYSFVPQALKDKVPLPAVKELFSTQFKQITGKDADPSVLNAFVAHENATPIASILHKLHTGEMSAQDATDTFGSPGKAIEFLNNEANVKAHQTEANASATRAADIQGSQGLRQQRLDREAKALKEKHVNAIHARLDNLAKEIMTTHHVPADEAYAQAHAILSGTAPPAPMGVPQSGLPPGVTIQRTIQRTTP